MKNNTVNLFEIATKELSQDAFLIWLFNNWNSSYDDVREASRLLISKIIGVEEKQHLNIKSLETRAQENKIDVLVDCIIDEVAYVIAIEDKTTSFVHNNQIKRYQDYIKKKYRQHQKRFIFYKTYLLTDNERNNIEKQNWQVFDIKIIYDIFNNIDATLKNNILMDYVEYINILYENLTGILPEDISMWNNENWVNFCINQKLEVPKEIFFGFGNFQNKYIYVVFNLNGNWHEVPYGEIRSRDFKQGKYKNKFLLRILIYGTEKDILENKLGTWKGKFGNSEHFILQNHHQQIAINKNMDSINSVKDLKLALEKYMKIYKEIML